MRTGDRSIARRLLALQFSYIDAAGRAYSRHDFLAGLKNLSALATGDPKLTMYGLLATVTGQVGSLCHRRQLWLDFLQYPFVSR